jgi:hypothetical protein
MITGGTLIGVHGASDEGKDDIGGHERSGSTAWSRPSP